MTLRRPRTPECRWLSAKQISIEGPRPSARGRKEEKAEAKQDRRFSAIRKWPEASMGMNHEIGHGRQAAKKEGERLRKDPQQEQHAKPELHRTCHPIQRHERCGFSAVGRYRKHVETLRTMLNKLKRRHDPENAEAFLRVAPKKGIYPGDVFHIRPKPSR